MLTLLSQYSKKNNKSIINNEETKVNIPGGKMGFTQTPLKTNIQSQLLPPGNPLKKQEKLNKLQEIYHKASFPDVSLQKKQETCNPPKNKIEIETEQCDNTRKHHHSDDIDEEDETNSTSSFSSSATNSPKKNQKPQIEQNSKNFRQNDENFKNERRLDNLKKAREIQKQNKLNSSLRVPDTVHPIHKIQKNEEVQFNEQVKTPKHVKKEAENDFNTFVYNSNKQRSQQSDTHTIDNKATTKNQYKRKSKLEKYNMWNKDCRFISIDPPIKLPDESKTRYKISFKYYCAIDNKIKRKTLCFGKKDTQYFVDHNDENKNKLWLSKQRGYYTPFHKNFWINYILCSENSVSKAYNKTLEMLINE